jgi:hypothetical protein
MASVLIIRMAVKEASIITEAEKTKCKTIHGTTNEVANLNLVARPI